MRTTGGVQRGGWTGRSPGTNAMAVLQQDRKLTGQVH